MNNKNLIALMSRITENANKLIISELKKRGVTGIVPSHGGILSCLFNEEKYTMKDLSEKIHRTKPTVTVLVDKLVTLGYVIKEKSENDSRITFISLTEEGKNLQPIFNEVSDELNDVVYKNLSEETINMLQENVTLILQNFDD